MGMSIDEAPHVELAAIISGGEEFLKRVASLQEANVRADAALADLKLGRSARDAYEHAQKLVEDAKAQVAAIHKAAEAKMAEAEQIVERAKATRDNVMNELRQLGVKMQAAKASA